MIRAVARLAKPDPLRQSSIARGDQCMLSLRLAHQTPDVGSDLAARGTLFHRFAAKALAMMRANGEDKMPVEMGLELLREVMAQRDVPAEEVVHLPMREAEWLRIIVTKWCYNGVYRSSRIQAIERRLFADVPVPDGHGGTYQRTITGRPDVLVADPPDGMLVIDWKAGFAAPANRREAEDEPTEDRLSDHGYVQQVVYGILVLMNHPLVERVTLREFYLLYGEYREATIWRWRIEQYLDLLGALISQIDQAFDEGPRSKRWIPTAGTHCAMCPDPFRCPIRKTAKVPTTEEEARKLFQEWHVSAERRKRLTPMLKGYVEENGPFELDHAKGRRMVGWIDHKTGSGRSFRVYEPSDAPGPLGIPIDDES